MRPGSAVSKRAKHSMSFVKRIDGMNGKTLASRGCFFCKTGKEADVIRYFNMAFPNGEAIAPTRTRIRRTPNAAIEERVSLLPGYVFFQITANGPGTHRAAGDIQTALLDFSKNDNVLKLLRYSDGTWRLLGSDDRFAEMLFEVGGNIGLSQAYYDKGNKIRILEGFLKDYEGFISNVNRKKKTVELTVDFNGKKTVMWLGYELVEAVEGQTTGRDNETRA